MRHRSRLLFFFPVDIHLLQQHLLKRWSFLHWITVVPLSKISWAYLCGSISGFSILSIDPSLCNTTQTWLLLVYHKSKIRKTDSFHFVLFCNVVLVNLIPLPFYINFRIILSISTNTLAGILIGIFLNLYTISGQLIFLLCCLQMLEYGMSLLLCIPF